MKRWGFVTAKPSEYLVHVRNGRVRATSGQGGSCFRYPWDAVSLIPTTLQRLQFRADQITAEKVGVEIVGLAVYRIADPMLAYRVLDFDGNKTAQVDLVETLTSMFVGATRRLVANLGVEACLAERKSALSVELLEEITPIIGGSGRPADQTDRGWGVVIDTLEIQEVRILSERVFDALQAPYRAAIDQRAREARAVAEDAMRSRDAASDRANAERVTQAKIAQAELAQREAQALLAAAEAEAARSALEARQKVAAAELKASLERIAAEGQRIAGESLAALAARRAEIDRAQSENDARRLVAQNLPALAAAMGQRIQEVRVHTVGTAAEPLAQLASFAKAAMDMIK